MRTKITFAIIICIGYVLSNSIAFSQANSESEIQQVKQGFSLDNPQFTLRSFFECFEKEKYNPDNATKAMNFSTIKKNINRRDLAIKLKKIIDNRGMSIKVRNLSLNPNFIDSLTMTHQYRVVEEIPEIYLEKYRNKWMFSAETAENIEKIYQQTVPFDLSSIVDILPDSFHYGFCGVELWQVLFLIIYIVIGSILANLLKVLSQFILKKFFLKMNRELFIKSELLIPIARHFSKIIVLLLFIAVVPTLELPLTINAIVQYSLKILVPIFSVLALFKVIDIVSEVLHKISAKTENTLDDHLVPFASKVMKGFVLVLATFYILDVLNVNITPLLAGVSIGGLAFALAAQDTVNNIFGSLTIFIDQPFVIGDWIKFSDGEGVIEEVGLRSTRIRTFEDSLITIPNGKLADAVINNIGKRNFRRYSPVLNITYSTQQELILAFVKGIKEIIANHPHTLKDNIQTSFYNYSQSSLEIRVVMYFDIAEFQDELIAREEINLGFFKLAEDLGISFAFPSHSIYIENQDANPKLNTSEIDGKLMAFINQNNIKPKEIND